MYKSPLLSIVMDDGDLILYIDKVVGLLLLSIVFVYIGSGFC